MVHNLELFGAPVVREPSQLPPAVIGIRSNSTLNSSEQKQRTVIKTEWARLSLWLSEQRNMSNTRGSSDLTVTWIIWRWTDFWICNCSWMFSALCNSRTVCSVSYILLLATQKICTLNISPESLKCWSLQILFRSLRSLDADWKLLQLFN